MTKRVFFAAFVIDEEAYLPQPDDGPVDAQYVVSHLAQAMEGPGIDDFMVWGSIDDLIADHRERGPISVGYLDGDRR